MKIRGGKPMIPTLAQHRRQLRHMAKQLHGCPEAHGLAISHAWVPFVVRRDYRSEGRGGDQRSVAISVTESVVCGNCGEVRKITKKDR